MSLVGAALLLPVGLWAATAGPDSEGLVLTDSEEPDGPPHGLIDVSDGAVVDVASGERVEVTLPFVWSWYGESVEAMAVGADGVAFFGAEAPTPTCPGEGGAWSGVAARWGTTESAIVRTRTVGRYPFRAFITEWSDPGQVQMWMLERRQEAVIVLEDRGDVDGVAGAQAGPSTGLAWACSVLDLSDGRSAWVGDQASRPVSAMRSTDALDVVWWGTTSAQFFGGTLAVGDANDDGLNDLLVGEPEGARAYLFFGMLHSEGAVSTDAAMTLIGPDGSRFGAAVALADLDEDGAVINSTSPQFTNHIRGVAEKVRKPI